uniref:ATP synthase subunit b', chloroplastic n=1 Tax=Chloropicon laureae TaxID=464258 RepID=A0A7S2Z2C8_9CHLO|mmetsp:Transcript_14939/g.31001  ORF Transcript_14939/g.31001 Transcript_14939/m.31001 type:complete len:220 (+) Transcript_14939:96-755(+)
MEKVMNARSCSVVATSTKKSLVSLSQRQARARCAVKAQAMGSPLNKVQALRAKFSALEKAVGVQLLLAAPALAEEAAKEPGKLFDFDVTLPIMAVQFLVLMVFLDKTWFSPVGKVLDERDENLREKLSSVQDNTGDVKKYEDEAAKVVADARQEAANMIADAKKGAEKEGEASLEALKAKLEAQYQSAATALEKEEADARAALDPEIEKLAKQIVDKVL